MLLHFILDGRNSMKEIKTSMTYEPEADVLSWKVADGDIDHAQEFGDFVVHFSSNHVPVLIEVLQAKNFLKRSAVLVEENEKESNAA